jgi:hypothetical protein
VWQTLSNEKEIQMSRITMMGLALALTAAGVMGMARPASAANAGIKGKWFGSLQISANKLRLGLNLAESSDAL